MAQALGYRYADEEIIVRAAEEAGVPKETVEQAEHPAGLIARILEAIARTPIEPESWATGAMLAVDAAGGHEGLIKQVIRSTADDGGVVIVAHGGSMCLAGRNGVLRVLVTGTPSVRAERLVAGGMNERDATKTVAESDRQRREYLKHFYAVGDELPTHYDLVINTDALATEQAAALIAEAAKG